jgi:hypothetical protein
MLYGYASQEFLGNCSTNRLSKGCRNQKETQSMKKSSAGGLCGIIIQIVFIPIFAFPQLTREWAVTYDGGTQTHISFDRIHAMHVDANGNVILVGSTEPAPFTTFITTIKYDPNGNVAWKKDYDVTAWGTAVETSIPSAIDRIGNVYVATQGTVGDKAGWVGIKYNPNGELVKTMVFVGASDIADVPNAMTIDDLGNIFITGDFNTGGLNWDCATIKADSAGNQIWTSKYDSGGWDNGLFLYLDNAGNVIVAADVCGFGTDDDIGTLKYNPQGELQWVNDYNGGGEQYQPEGFRDDWPVAIQTDAFGDVYVTGYSQFTYDGPYGIVTMKYSGNGNQLWQKRIENAVVNAMQVDPAGNVCLTGYTFNEEGWRDLLTCKYSTDGTLIWKTVYQGSANGNDQGNAVTTDSKGNTFVTGEINADVLSGIQDLIVLQYDASGKIIGSDTYESKDHWGVFAKVIEISPDGFVYVAGMDNGWHTAFDYLLIKYSQAGTGIDQLNHELASIDLPKGFILDQNYPNPFNSNTLVTYQLKKQADVALFLYDAAGSLVRTLVKETQNAGAHQVSINGNDLPSGTYICRLRVDGQNAYKKMVLLR